MNAALTIPIVVLALVASITPLTDQQRTRLNTAVDGRDHQEEAFAALRENILTWSSEDLPGDAAVRLKINRDALLDDPDQYRGTIYQIAGRVEQIEQLAGAFDDMVGSFIRDEDSDDRALIAYIPASRAEELELREGVTITGYARFYKTMQFTARDGQMRRYPAFVGMIDEIKSRRDAVADQGVAYLLIIAIPLAVLLCAFGVLLYYIRRTRSDEWSRSARLGATGDVDEDVASLPDDPADALAELRRRADHLD